METKLGNYCPNWIISIVTAQSAIEFLSGSSTLTITKYARGLSEQYEPGSFQYLEGVAEEKLRTLSEIERRMP